MNKSYMNFIKGMGAGALAGMAMATGKSAKKAVNAVGDIVDSVQEIFR